MRTGSTNAAAKLFTGIMPVFMADKLAKSAQDSFTSAVSIDYTISMKGNFKSTSICARINYERQENAKN